MDVTLPTPSQYDASPNTAIEAIAAHAGPVLVDLDETLYLRNSTEDFIDLARPGVLALLCMRALDFVKPWRWTGGEATRDVWRVRTIWTLFPWTRARWRRAVASYAGEHGNQPLIAALLGRKTMPVILTAGFQPIVTPLVAALGFPNAKIVAARLNSCQDRRDGKLTHALRELGPGTISAGLVVTDSTDDLALLGQCAHPLRTIWPAARFRRALGHVYLPGEYITHVKRPGEGYILHVIVLEDLGFWIFASVELAVHPLLHMVGLSLLLLSFWSIYESGYVDNDRSAARFESDPKLSQAFRNAPVATPRTRPWLWALASGTVAICLLRWPGRPGWTDLAQWLAVLIGTYGCFWLYNRIDKSTRVWLYAPLQLARAAAFIVLVPVSAAGAIGLGAQALSRWVPYYVYRMGHFRDWPRSQPNIIRLVFLVALGSLMGVSQGARSLFTWTALMIFVFSVYRARIELKDMFRNIHRIDRGGTAAP